MSSQSKTPKLEEEDEQHKIQFVKHKDATSTMTSQSKTLKPKEGDKKVKEGKLTKPIKIHRKQMIKNKNGTTEMIQDEIKELKTT